MGPSRICALLILPVLAGCASLNAYRAEPIMLQSLFTSIENYGPGEIRAEEVDRLFLEVADLLSVRLRANVPRPRIAVTNPDRIASLYDGVAAGVPGYSRAVALYFPSPCLIIIPYFDRILLGHELAHYFTDHYLNTPRAQWEDIAHDVESKLARATPGIGRRLWRIGRELLFAYRSHEAHGPAAPHEPRAQLDVSPD